VGLPGGGGRGREREEKGVKKGGGETQGALALTCATGCCLCSVVQAELQRWEGDLQRQVITEGAWDKKAKRTVQAWLAKEGRAALMFEVSTSDTMAARIIRTAAAALKNPATRREALGDLAAQLQVGTFHKRPGGWPLAVLWAALTSEMRKFVVFCISRHTLADPKLPLFPLRDTSAVQFANWLLRHGLSTGGRHYLAEAVAWGTNVGYTHSFDAEQLMARQLRSVMAVRAATKVTKREVRGGDAVLPPQTLVAIMANLPRATPGQKLFRTMVLWHWFSQLRPCHFTYSAIKDHRSLLRWDQLVPTCEAHETLADAGITLIAIRTASKTNQAGINAFTTAVGCLCNTKSANMSALAWQGMCPVHNFLDYFASMLEPPKSDFVFAFEDGAPYPRSLFDKELKQALREALPHLKGEWLESALKSLSPKSFRSGAGTEMANNGASRSQIMSALGHKSFNTSQQFYVKPSAEQSAARNRLLTGSIDKAFCSQGLGGGTAAAAALGAGAGGEDWSPDWGPRPVQEGATQAAHDNIFKLSCMDKAEMHSYGSI
jgi:hypothetical protein